MSIVHPDKESWIAEFIASHPGSDYQKYLLNYDDRFVQCKAERLCSTGTGVFFRQVTDVQEAALARLVLLEWDSTCLGFQVAQISDIFGNSVLSKTALLEEIKSYARDTAIKLITCRIAYDDFTSLPALEQAGFRVVDAMSIFFADGQHITAPAIPEYKSPGVTIARVDRADQQELTALREIAAPAFQHSRLYNDPHFSQHQIQTFYGLLAESFLKNGESLILAARYGGRAIGFAIGEKDVTLSTHLKSPLGYLSMITVDAAFTGRGVAHLLFTAFLHHFSQQVRFIEVGTQINNYPALNLYAKHGLKQVSSLITMHLWI